MAIADERKRSARKLVDFRLNRTRKIAPLRSNTARRKGRRGSTHDIRPSKTSRLLVVSLGILHGTFCHPRAFRAAIGTRSSSSSAAFLVDMTPPAAGPRVMGICGDSAAQVRDRESGEDWSASSPASSPAHASYAARSAATPSSPSRSASSRLDSDSCRDGRRLAAALDRADDPPTIPPPAPAA